MHTRATLTALVAAALLALSLTAVATAAPTQLTVRIEGKDRTLFEGPILTEGHEVQAASDTEPHPCDGTNNGAHPEPSATPIAASADAMAIAGEDFDGEWYPGFDDYFITRWGPDSQFGDAFWGILVNGAFTPVGGCQYANAAGDEVLWAFDAFNSRPFLRLAAAADPSLPPGPALPTASVEQDEPLALAVKSSTGAMDGAPESIQPVASALVAPVATDPVTGYQEVATGDPAAVATAGDGGVSISFPTPGWQRLKAVKSGYVRSNRLDVCVEPPGGGSCGPLPGDAQVRTPPAQPPPPETPGPSLAGSPPPAAALSRSPGVSPAPSAFALGRVKANVRSGVAVLAISVPGPGRLTVSGSKVKRTTIWADAAATLKLSVKARGRALERLRKAGKVTVAVTVAFSPAVGAAATAHRDVVLRLGEATG